MIIGYDNKYSLATLTASDEEPAFPIARSQDIRLSRLYKSLTTDINIVIDLGSDLTATAFFIANHNLSATADIDLEANTTDSWTTPAHTESITYSSDIIYKLFSSKTYRYWRITIKDTSNVDGLIKFGGCFLGTYQTPPNFSHTITEKPIDTTSINWSMSRQPYIDVNTDYLTYDINYPYVTLTQKDTLKAFMKVNKKKPVYILLDETSVSEFAPIYGIISDFSYSRVFNNFYTTNTTITEAK